MERRIAVVLMASGYSERFGSNKLLEPFGNRCLFTYAVDLACASDAAMKIIVTRYEPIKHYVKENAPKMDIVWNDHPERGISESIHLGIRYLRQSKDYEKYAGCCFMVCDQPLLQKQSLQKLFESFYRNPEGIHMCVTKEREGNPVIFPKILFEELMALEGDKGGKRIAKEHPEMIYKVYVTEQELSDMDYQEDKINLEERIKKDGKALGKTVLKVDSFINHQVDSEFMDALGKDFAEHFKEYGITKVFTIESSGIAPALMTAKYLDVPMVILKKQTSKILNGKVYQTRVTSFTKGTSYELTLYQDYIDQNDKVLLIDDFLANGEAAMGASRLIKESGADLTGIGILIEKSFQKGRKRLEDAGYYVYSQARVGRLDKDLIEFLPEDAPVLEGVDEQELLDK